MTDAAVRSASAIVADRRAVIDRAIVALCDRYLGDIEGPVGDAIRYSLIGEGKRMRGILLCLAFEAAGGRGDATELAAAVEVVHAYSLVHDDLPCMDDDDVRRGRATVHKVFGVGAATAAGLAMVPLAAMAAMHACESLALDAGTTGEIIADLMRASGAGGMIGGQLLDLEGEARELTLAELEQVHRAKTGALIAASATLGGRAARTSPERLAALALYGADVGLAFQIADDVLDVTATTDQLGKTAGRDEALKKSTYPALLGIDGAKARAAALVKEGCGALENVGLLTSELAWIAHFTVERTS
jgi:geranylgeranyl pyrophosphate synthase